MRSREEAVQGCTGTGWQGQTEPKSSLLLTDFLPFYLRSIQLFI